MYCLPIHCSHCDNNCYALGYTQTLDEIHDDVIKWHIFHVHDDVIKWKYFPRNWPFVPGIHRSPANSPHKGQWRGALMFSLICVWINGWVSNREAGDLRRYRTHYDVTVILLALCEGNSRHGAHYDVTVVYADTYHMLYMHIFPFLKLRQYNVVFIIILNYMIEGFFANQPFRDISLTETHSDHSMDL